MQYKMSLLFFEKQELDLILVICFVVIKVVSYIKLYLYMPFWNSSFSLAPTLLECFLVL